MTGSLRRVYVYGFKPDELASLATWRASGLQPVSMELDESLTPSEGVPAVVHASQAVDLTRRFEAEGIVNDIILYLPSGMRPPAGAYSDAIVRQDEFARLVTLVTHPEQLRLREFAEDVPLRLLTRPIATLNLARLGLPAPFAGHLSTCPTCPGSFREALRERVRLYQRLSCPSPDALIAYARTAQDPGGKLRAHLNRCPLCEAQVHALNTALWPATSATLPEKSTGVGGRRVLMAIPYVGQPDGLLARAGRHVREDLEELYSGLAAAFGPLLVLFDLVSRGDVAGWEPAGGRKAGGLNEDDPDLEAWIATTLWQVYQDRSFVSLSYGRRQLLIGWDPDTTSPYLESAGVAQGAGAEFSVEIRAGERGDRVWSANSVGGRLVVPVAAVQSALESYTSEHGVPQDGGYTLTILEGAGS